MVSDAAPRAIAPREMTPGEMTPGETTRGDEPPREMARYWQHGAVEGVDLLRARFVTHRYGRHSHETYTFGLIEAGVEEFDYGGTLLRAGSGGVVLLNPDTVHTGQAGTPDGWSYRVLYPEVSVVTSIAAELGWQRGAPWFPQTVLYDPATAVLLRRAHQ